MMGLAIVERLVAEACVPWAGWDAGRQEATVWLLLFCCVLNLFYVCEYTVAVFRHTGRGLWVPLPLVVSHCVLAGN